MSVIKIKNLTKKYKNNYGIFNINLDVKEGEVYGYLGPNGAGKSTTIRHIMGYIKSQTGTIEILGKDAWKQAHEIQGSVGYLPGEIAFPEQMNGLEFIKMIFNLRNQDNWDYVEELIKYWEFNPNMKIKKMSKGMKQKVALIIAFMHNPKLLILDEPTTGLDPLMQERFIDLVLKAKEAKRTVLMSSHIFGEIEKTCDKVAIIKSGRIVSDVDLRELEEKSEKRYSITFANKFMDSKFITKNEGQKILYTVPFEQVEKFFDDLKKYEVKMFKEIPFSLEEYFLDFYKKEEEIKLNKGGQENA